MNESSPPHGEWVEPSETDGLPEQMRGMRAYMVRPLPSDVVVPTNTHRVQAATEHILGRLTERTLGLPDRRMFELCMRLCEVQSAAEMAGTSMALSETFLTRLLLTRAADGVGEPEEVLLERTPAGRALRAVEHGAARLRDGAAFDAKLVGEIGEKLTGEVPGTVALGLRTCQSWLGGGSTGQPPILTVPPGALLHSAFAQWSTWIAAPHPLPRVGKIAMGHLNLALLDPYPGAGPYLTGLYSASQMVRMGLLRHPVLSLSTWLDEHSKEYYRQIRAVVDGGPIEVWISFFAGAVHAQAAAQLALINRLNTLSQKMLKQAKGSPTVQRVVSGLITAPVTSNRALEVRYGMANKTAAQTTRHLEKAGILEVVGNKSYNKVFVCQKVLDLYALQVPSAPESDRTVFSPPAN